MGDNVTLDCNGASLVGMEQLMVEEYNQLHMIILL